MGMEQERYQVRFDWAEAGAVAIGSAADVLVWVDAIQEPGASAPLGLIPETHVVLASDIGEAHAVAQWIIDYQVRRGARISIAIVAAGSTRAGQTRFAVEDLLAAGAIIDHLAALGLDATSPEAAAAEAAYRGLGRATAHLMSASTTAVERQLAPSAVRVDAAKRPADVRILRSDEN
jgi:2-phosphosulfolactate phosphatase